MNIRVLTIGALAGSFRAMVCPGRPVTGTGCGGWADGRGGGLEDACGAGTLAGSVGGALKRLRKLVRDPDGPEGLSVFAGGTAGDGVVREVRSGMEEDWEVLEEPSRVVRLPEGWGGIFPTYARCPGSRNELSNV
jgi:hypothetical protein